MSQRRDKTFAFFFVGAVHVGLVQVIQVRGSVEVRETEQLVGRLVAPSELRSLRSAGANFETWSSLLVDALDTGAIVAPYVLDARLCIAYLTIEHPGPIPVEFRATLGNRVYGCDDCQLVCPWNRYARRSPLPDFDARLGAETLLELWRWTEADFLQRTEGSAIRRIGFERWRRNLAVALGNAWRETGEPAVAQALAAPLPRDGLAASPERRRFGAMKRILRGTSERRERSLVRGLLTTKNL